MPPNTFSISGDEMYLRLTAPEFFSELIRGRTATLIESGTPEDLAAWTEERRQKDQLWTEILQANPTVQQQAADREIFNEAVQGYVREVSAFHLNSSDPDVIHASIADLIQSELDPPWDHNTPPLDMRFVLAAEIEKHQQRERNDQDLSGKSLSEQGPFFREEYLQSLAPSPAAGVVEATKELLQEQAAVGREVAAMKNELEAPQQEIKIPPPKIDPPSNS